MPKSQVGRKVLIVGQAMAGASGGAQCMERNVESVTEIFGADCSITRMITPRPARGVKGLMRRLPNLMRGYCAGLDRTQTQDLLRLIAEEKLTDVYIDTNLYGSLARSIKRSFPAVRVTVFFHNCEYDYALRKLKAERKFADTYGSLIIRHNERLACRYADSIIVLNERDRQALLRHYGRRADHLIPITFRSDIDSAALQNISARDEAAREGQPLQGLFVGSYFYGNTEGLRWFCKEVLPHVNLHFTIVGAGMERLAEEVAPLPNLEIHGRVADLTPYYAAADAVIMPIISGGGMKVKTAESLMHGKYLIGTPEAFEGYDITEAVGTICPDAAAFITTINSLQRPPRYNPPSRHLFEEKYSFASSLPLFRQVFLKA